MTGQSRFTGTVVRAVLLTAVAAAALIMVANTPAHAHSVLVSSTPTDNATVRQEPTRVRFTFNENVGPAFVSVLAPDRRPAAAGKPGILDHTVTQKLRPTGLAGRYTFSYRVVSADGHPVEATLHFTVTDGRAVAVTPPDGTHRSSFAAHRTAILAVAVAALLLLVLLLWPRRPTPRK